MFMDTGSKNNHPLENYTSNCPRHSGLKISNAGKEKPKKILLTTTQSKNGDIQLCWGSFALISTWEISKTSFEEATKRNKAFIVFSRAAPKVVCYLFKTT